jgi:type VI secretion system secreted protein Hcp
LGAQILGEWAIMAYRAYISIKGQKRDQFSGDGSNKQNKDRILIPSFSFSGESPRDVASGQASGKQHYQPIIIHKRWGEASTQVHEALATNETSPSVFIEFITTDPRGAEVVDHSFSLTNATISALSDFTEGAQSARQIDELEEISFSFQKIEIKDKSGKTFVDAWVA